MSGHHGPDARASTRADVVVASLQTLKGVRLARCSLAHLKSRGGDFVEADLVAALDGDEVGLEIAGPLPGLAELLNTGTCRPGCAVALDATTDPGLRALTLRRFERGAFQSLINVGLFTEGFDSPRLACVAVARSALERVIASTAARIDR